MALLYMETDVRSGRGIICLLLNIVMTHYCNHFTAMTKHWKLNELGGNYPDIAISFGAHSECVLSP